MNFNKFRAFWQFFELMLVADDERQVSVFVESVGDLGRVAANTVVNRADISCVVEDFHKHYSSTAIP